MRVISYPYSPVREDTMEVTSYIYLNNRQDHKASIADLKLFIKTAEAFGATDEDLLEDCDISLGFSIDRDEIESIFNFEEDHSTSNKTIYSRFSTYKSDYR